MTLKKNTIEEQEMSVHIISKNGQRRKIDNSKILEKAEVAVEGLLGVSAEKLMLDAEIQFQDGMTTYEIDEILIATARQNIEEHSGNWTFVAARLSLTALYHSVGRKYGTAKGKKYPMLESYMQMAVATGKMHKSFMKKFDLTELDSEICPERDKQFTLAGFRLWKDRYAITDAKKETIELPQHMFMAIAMFLAQKEEDPMKWAKVFYHRISTFEVMLATPTLSSARLKRHQLASCFVGSHEDSIDGIYDGYKEKAFMSKLGGGIGWDWSETRASDSTIDVYEGVANGSIPFLKIENDNAVAVDQLGVRKGGIAPYLPDWHMDIMTFLKMKDKGGEERVTAQDFLHALWVSDLFMKRIAENGQWTLFDPYDARQLNNIYGDEFELEYEKLEADTSIRKIVIMAKVLWKEVCERSFLHGTPVIGFKDAANRGNPLKKTGIIRSSNLCTEIFQNTEPDRWIHTISFDSGEPIIGIESDKAVLSDGTHIQICKLEKGDVLSDGRCITETVKVRKEGQTAVCNLASLNMGKVGSYSEAKLKSLIYDSVRMLDNVIDNNLYPTEKSRNTALSTRAIGLGVMGEAEHMARNKIMWNSTAHRKEIDRFYSMYSRFSEEASEALAVEKGTFPLCEEAGITPPRRNGYLRAIAPTSSISIFVGTTQCVEPIYQRKWFEENLNGLTPCVAPGINAENYEFYISAYNVNMVEHVITNGRRTGYMDQGISLSIFVDPEKIDSLKQISDIYTTAWEQGNKSVYYLRSQAPDVEAISVIDRAFECSGCQ